MPRRFRSAAERECRALFSQRTGRRWQSLPAGHGRRAAGGCYDGDGDGDCSRDCKRGGSRRSGSWRSGRRLAACAGGGGKCASPWRRRLDALYPAAGVCAHKAKRRRASFISLTDTRPTARPPDRPWRRPSTLRISITRAASTARTRCSAWPFGRPHRRRPAGAGSCTTRHGWAGRAPVSPAATLRLAHGSARLTRRQVHSRGGLARPARLAAGICRVGRAGRCR